MLTLDLIKTLVTEWAEKREMFHPVHGTDPFAQFEKLLEETTELFSALRGIDLPDVEDAIGDCMVVLTILAESAGTDITKSYNRAYNQIKDRKGKMLNGVFVKEG